VFRCSDLDVDMSHACMHIFRRFRNTAKKSVGFISSVRLSPHGKYSFPLDRFVRNLIFDDFSNICPEDSRLIKILHE
jgi:hypothetical protein